MNLDDLKKRCEQYFKSLHDNPIPNVYSEDTLKYISGLKRPYPDDTKIGEYPGISVFEAVNRIASDLILWYGLEILITQVLKNKKIADFRLCLGNENDKDHGDFSIRIDGEVEYREGEVFNAAKSFFKRKTQDTKKKWIKKGKPLHYILCNKDGYPDGYKPQNIFQWDGHVDHIPQDKILLVKVDLIELMQKGNPLSPKD